MKEYDYTLVDTYINTNTKMKTICPNGHIYEVRLSSFKEGNRCPKCKQVTFETVKSNVEKMGFELLTEKENYTNTSMKLKVKCCNGHIQEKRYDSFLANKGCWICRNENKKLKYEEVKQYLEKEGYVLLSKEYENNSIPLVIKCPNGHEYETTFSTFKQGGRCKTCYHENLRVDYEEVKQCFEKEGYKLLEENYVNSKTKMKTLCPNGHIHYVSFGNFKYSENRCLKCQENSISKGEMRIKTVLENMNVDFIQQYRFKDCKDKRELPFDFYIPTKNIVIEFDGEQHFREKDKFGGLEGFATTIIHDCIKNNFCEENQIKLIRIPYWEIDNIESILKQQII